jgi:hypothetical protein
MLKMVGASGQLSLGKRFAGRYFQIDERADGTIVMLPMEVIPKAEAPVRRRRDVPRFQIAEVKEIVIPSREQRNARR